MLREETLKEGSKFLNDLVARLMKLSSEELDYVLSKVHGDVTPSDVATDESLDQREVRLT